MPEVHCNNLTCKHNVMNNCYVDLLFIEFDDVNIKPSVGFRCLSEESFEVAKD